MNSKNGQCEQNQCVVPKQPSGYPSWLLAAIQTIQISKLTWIFQCKLYKGCETGYGI